MTRLTFSTFVILTVALFQPGGARSEDVISSPAAPAPAAARIAFPAALDGAAVTQSSIADINRNGLVLGNGDLSALLWERQGTLCLRVTKNDVWDARVDTSADPPMLRVDIPNQKWSGGSGSPPSYAKPYPQPRCAAIIRLGEMTKPDGDAGIRSARLDLRRAVAELQGSGPTRTIVRTLEDRNAFLIETDKDVFLEEIKAAELPAAEHGVSNGVKWMHVKMPGDVDYAGMEYALAAAFAGRQKAVSLVTSFDTRKSVQDEAIRIARETVAAEPAGLVARHEKAWARYWSASGVELGDSDFQSWWYRMAYFLRCFAKSGVVPAGLWGVLPNDTPGWHGDYHHNYNAWQPYWTPFVLNHPDLADPWVRYMNELLPRLRWLAKTTYDCEGACVGISSFAFEPDPAKCKSVNQRQIGLHPWSGTLGMAGMSAQILWYRHLYQPDRKYLEESIYPVLREVALFYCSFAEKCPHDAQGKAKFGPSYSPEHGDFGVANVPFDLAYARFTLKAAIAAARELGRDESLAARFSQALDLLPGYPTAPDASGRPVVVDWTGCKFREIGEHNITVPAVPVFPGDQVTWFSPEPEKELFKNTLLQTRHRGANSTVMFSVAKARLSMLDALDDARQYYRPQVQPNGMFYWPLHGFYLSESVGLAAMISEYLLQSVDNIIRVFPCWPKGNDAKYADLRSQGGFLVSAEQTSGQVKFVKLHSTVAGRAKFLNPWTTAPQARKNGATVSLTDEGGGVYSLGTAAGDLVELTPKS